MRILLLEDNVDIAELEMFMLTSNGHVVVHLPEASTDLFEELFWASYDVAVLDLMLAGSRQNGIEVAEWLMGHVPHVRRVIVSALAHIIRDLPDDLAVYVAKPFTEADLLAAVEGP